MSFENIFSVIEKQEWNEIFSYENSEIKKMNKDLQTPLHLASKYDAPIQVLHYLLTNYPIAAIVEDKFGYTPVLYLPKLSSEEKLFIFLKHAKDCFNTSKCYYNNIHRTTPFHKAIENDRSVELLREMIKVDSQALLKRNKNGNSPINLFFWQWYVPLKKLLKPLPIQTKSCKRKESEQKEKEECESAEALLNMKIKRKDSREHTLRYVYNVACLLLEHGTTASNDNHFNHQDHETKKNALFLSIQNKSCPWLWCDLFLRTNPELLLQINPDGFILPLLINSFEFKKIHFYDKLFTCDTCGISREKIWLKGDSKWCGAYRCRCYSYRYYERFHSDVLWKNLDYDEEVAGQCILSILCTLIQWNPSIYANTALNKMPISKEMMLQSARKKRKLDPIV